MNARSSRCVEVGAADRGGLGRVGVDPAGLAPVDVVGVHGEAGRHRPLCEPGDELPLDACPVEVGAADSTRRGDPRVTEYLGPVDVVVIDRDLSDAFLGSSGGVGDECPVDLRTVEPRAGNCGSLLFSGVGYLAISPPVDVTPIHRDGPRELDATDNLVDPCTVEVGASDRIRGGIRPIDERLGARGEGEGQDEQRTEQRKHEDAVGPRLRDARAGTGHDISYNTLVSRSYRRVRASWSPGGGNRVATDLDGASRNGAERAARPPGLESFGGLGLIQAELRRAIISACRRVACSPPASLSRAVCGVLRGAACSRVNAQVNSSRSRRTEGAACIASSAANQRTLNGERGWVASHPASHRASAPRSLPASRPPGGGTAGWRRRPRYSSS